jgi:hypothetical protein
MINDCETAIPHTKLIRQALRVWEFGGILGLPRIFKQMFIRVMLTLIVLSSCTLDKQLLNDRKELVGIWQSIPEIASGWTDTYQFSDNGEFIFNYSQMICDKRTLHYSGRWELTNANNLRLTVHKRTILEGGELVSAMGSCVSEFEIKGGEVKYITLNNIEPQNFQLSIIVIDAKNRDLKTRTLDGKPFWKLNDDPTKY